jgi:hypothetical protein
MSIRYPNLGHNTECCHQCNLETETRSPPLWPISREKAFEGIEVTYQRHCKTVSICHSRAQYCFVYPHPGTENCRRTQSSPYGSVGNHEHFRFSRIFSKICFLHLDGNQNDTTEQHAEANEKAIGRPLRDQSQLGRIYRVRHVWAK